MESLPYSKLSICYVSSGFADAKKWTMGVRKISSSVVI